MKKQITSLEKKRQTLIKNGVICVAEGANMPCTAGAVKRFEHAKVLFAPVKQVMQEGLRHLG